MPNNAGKLVSQDLRPVEALQERSVALEAEEAVGRHPQIALQTQAWQALVLRPQDKVELLACSASLNLTSLIDRKTQSCGILLSLEGLYESKIGMTFWEERSPRLGCSLSL
jgi:hypothetical protein